MLGTLIHGRVSVCGAAVNASKVALVIAVRRGLERRQFGPPHATEALLLDYRTHQRRLLIPLAANYALHFAQERLRKDLHSVFTEQTSSDDRRRRELETMAARPCGRRSAASPRSCGRATTTTPSCAIAPRSSTSSAGARSTSSAEQRGA